MECLNSQAVIDRSDNMEGEGRSQSWVRSGKLLITKAEADVTELCLSWLWDSWK